MSEFAAKKVGDTWTVTKDGSVHSGPYFSEREAKQAARRASKSVPPLVLEETMACPNCKGACVVNGEECEECWGKGRVTL